MTRLNVHIYFLFLAGSDSITSLGRKPKMLLNNKQFNGTITHKPVSFLVVTRVVAVSLLSQIKNRLIKP